MKAEEYFDEKAKNYHQGRSKGFIGSLVAKEEYLALKLLNPKKNEKILDAGCGSGFFSISIKNNGSDIFGIDISHAMINELRKRGINGKVADMEKLNLKKKFDKILCSGALEFTKHPQKVIRGFSKHLKKGGIIVLIYPKSSLVGYIYKLFHLLHGVSITLSTKKRIKYLVKGSGLKVVCIKNAHPLCNVALFKKI